MTQDELINLLVRKSLGYLRANDTHPEIGYMGLPYSIALDHAFNDTVTETARWNSIEALKLELTEEIKNQALIRIRKHRSQEPYKPYKINTACIY